MLGNSSYSSVKGKFIKLDYAKIGEILEISKECTHFHHKKLCTWEGFFKKNFYLSICWSDEFDIQNKRESANSNYARTRLGVWNLTIDNKLLHYFRCYILVPKANDYSHLTKFEI